MRISELGAPLSRTPCSAFVQMAHPHSLWVNHHALCGPHSAGRPLSFPCLPPFGSHLSHRPVTWWARGGLEGATEVSRLSAGLGVWVQQHWVVRVGCLHSRATSGCLQMVSVDGRASVLGTRACCHWGRMPVPSARVDSERLPGVHVILALRRRASSAFTTREHEAHDTRAAGRLPVRSRQITSPGRPPPLTHRPQVPLLPACVSASPPFPGDSVLCCCMCAILTSHLEIGGLAARPRRRRGRSLF